MTCLQKITINGQTYNLQPLTLLAGRNGAGKTKLLSALDLIKSWLLGHEKYPSHGVDISATFSNGMAYRLIISTDYNTVEDFTSNGKLVLCRIQNRKIVTWQLGDGQFVTNKHIFGLHPIFDWAMNLRLYDNFAHDLDFVNAKNEAERLLSQSSQVIIASHNQFAMDVIPLESWVILSQGKVYDYVSHKAIYDDYDFTGLNNFDFFTSNYFLRREDNHG